mmetsp:Transcript_12124/g.32017  ORF Transcript_12124/g.32017 Transcript_12124/m.32017 type:complete len:201 (+) Transcript_12124:43-645(+)
MTIFTMWSCVTNCNIAPKAPSLEQGRLPASSRLGVIERRALSRKVHTLAEPGGPYNGGGADTWFSMPRINTDNVLPVAPTRSNGSELDLASPGLAQPSSPTSPTNPRRRMRRSSSAPQMKRDEDGNLIVVPEGSDEDPVSPKLPGSPKDDMAMNRRISRRGMPRTKSGKAGGDDRRVSFCDDDNGATPLVTWQSAPTYMG